MQNQAVKELIKEYDKDIAAVVFRLDDLAPALETTWRVSLDRDTLVSEIKEDMKAHVCSWASQDERSLKGAVRGSILATVLRLMDD